jgi:S1-C subfamily serine protease
VFEHLKTLSEELADLVRTAGESVVRVSARPHLGASGIVWSADGVIITADHAIEREDRVEVGLPDGRTVGARLIGRDPTTDIAVVRAEAAALNPARPGRLESLRVGHIVVAVARPGRELQATLGIISAIGGPWRTMAGGQLDIYLQTDVAMHPGFSGGPLVTAEGLTIGLNTSGLARGISVAVPITTLGRVVEALLTHGRVRRAYLGIASQPVRLPDGVRERVGRAMGLVIVSVEGGSPADRAGLTVGDVIIAVGDQPVSLPDELLAQLTPDRIGRPLPIRVLRGGQPVEIVVTPGERS